MGQNLSQFPHFYPHLLLGCSTQPAQRIDVTFPWIDSLLPEKDMEASDLSGLYSMRFLLGIFFEGNTHPMGSGLSHSHWSREASGLGHKLESPLEGSLSFA